jgi:hypothetical protein
MFPKSLMLPWLEDPPPLTPARGATTFLGLKGFLGAMWTAKRMGSHRLVYREAALLIEAQQLASFA